MLKWFLPVLLLSGCATDYGSLAWQDEFYGLQEDVETRSLTEQIAISSPAGRFGYIYGPGNPFPPYPDYFYYEQFYGGYAGGPYAPLWGPPYDPFYYGSIGYPMFAVGGGYAIWKHRGAPSHAPHARHAPRAFPAPSAAPQAPRVHTAPRTGHRPHSPGPRGGRGKR